MNPLFKILAKPVIRAIDALLEKLRVQIQTGQTTEALQTVDELRDAVKSVVKYLES